MRHAYRGLAATAMTLALTGAASAQSTTTYYNQLPGGYQAAPIQPAATSTYQTPATAQPTLGSALYPATDAYAPQSVTTYAPQAPTSYAPQAPATYAPQQTGSSYAPATPTYTPQQVGTPYATAPAAPSPAAPSGYAAPAADYASPYTPSSTYVAPTYGTANSTYQPSNYGGAIASQPLPAPAAPTLPVPATAYTPSVPAAPTTTAPEVVDTDGWTYNLARFYPAVQACLRKSTAKNPVIANIQERDNKTMMLIGEGGSASYSTCSTGLTGTTVKANSDIRNIPPAFFAPLGSTFTVSPERPFQPIVDTDQKVIGWLVRTQPSRAVNQFGQAAGFDGQFIPPMMVNTSVGKS